LHVILTRQARTADFDILLITQHSADMPVAGKFPTAHTDAAAADRTLGITDTTSPLHWFIPSFR
jgi:hypothetical protein